MNGRVFALSAGTVTLDGATINGPTCANSGNVTSGTTIPKAPNTGFGVSHVDPLNNVVFAYGAGALVFVSLAFVMRKTSKK